MTLNEILNANGVSEEAVAAILAAMKEHKIFTASEENLDIRHGKLKTQYEGQGKQLEEALATIETLKKSTKHQEDAQRVISEHEAREKALLAELEQTKLESAIKVELLAAKAMDVDYLTFKLKEKGELALDEQGKIKGWDDKLAGLKTQFPTQFEAAGKKKVIENLLPGNGGDNAGITKEAFDKMGYQERLKVYQESPETYAELTKN